MNMMQLTIGFAVLTANVFPTSTLADDWTSGTNVGTQGVHGAYALNAQDGLFDLQLSCMVAEGANQDVFMVLKTLPDAPLQHGNETQFPVTLSYTYANGKNETAVIDVEWQRDDGGINVWHASFAVNEAFIRDFARSQTLALLYGHDDAVIFTYAMSGSAKAVETLTEYCFSGNYN